MYGVKRFIIADVGHAWPDVLSVPMPAGARVLTARVESDVLVVYALAPLHDAPGTQTYPHYFALVREGVPLGRGAEDCGRYVASFSFYGNALLLHLFDRGSPPGPPPGLPTLPARAT